MSPQFLGPCTGHPRIDVKIPLLIRAHSRSAPNSIQMHQDSSGVPPIISLSSPGSMQRQARQVDELLYPKNCRSYLTTFKMPPPGSSRLLQPLLTFRFLSMLLNNCKLLHLFLHLSCPLGCLWQQMHYLIHFLFLI